MSNENAVTIPVESFEVEKLKPYPNNTKIHDEDQIKRLAATIGRYGFTAPIVIDEDGTIIAGHGRRLAVIKLGWTHVPVQIVRGWTDARKNAFRIAENKVASDKYDADAMFKEIASIPENELRDFLPEAEFRVFMEQQMDLGSFVEDIDAEMAEFDDKRSEASETADKDKVATSKAFGFKQVTIEEQRAIKALMAAAETETELQGAAALIKYFDKAAA